MKLKSFGCSFIFGSELHDDGYGTLRATPSQHTWPALLARYHGLEYQCLAKPGSGNQRIAESVLNQIESGEPAVYVIGWTWIERFDFLYRNRGHWHTITAWDTDELAEYYYKNIHSQYQDKLNSLLNIGIVLENLQKIGARFLMTYMDDLLFETKFHHSAAMNLLQNQIRPHLHNFDGENFVDWSFHRGYPIGTRGKHPLEQAHQAAFEYMVNHHGL